MGLSVTPSSVCFCKFIKNENKEKRKDFRWHYTRLNNGAHCRFNVKIWAYIHQKDRNLSNPSLHLSILSHLFSSAYVVYTWCDWVWVSPKALCGSKWVVPYIQESHCSCSWFWSISAFQLYLVLLLSLQVLRPLCTPTTGRFWSAPHASGMSIALFAFPVPLLLSTHVRFI